MAVYPCDWTKHRYAQPQQSVYVTSVYRDNPETYALRLCPKHFEEVVLLVRQLMAELDDDSQVSTSCDQCGQDRDGATYVKVFRGKEEPQNFAADLCATHMVQYQRDLRIASGRALTAR